MLVSCAVKDLVAASGLRFGDRGGHSLKLVNGRCAALTIWGDAHRLSYLRQMSLVGQEWPNANRSEAEGQEVPKSVPRTMPFPGVDAASHRSPPRVRCEWGDATRARDCWRGAGRRCYFNAALCATTATPAQPCHRLTYHFKSPSETGFIRHVDKESGVPDWWQPFSESWTFHYPSKEAD